MLVCLPLRGATGLVWPPVADMPALEDALTGAALDLLRGRGARIAQALLAAEEVPHAAPLLRHGFRHVTVLEYLRRTLDPTAADDPPERLTYDAYDAGDADLFHETLLRTYEGTLDCPEVNHIRDIHDVIAGHQAQGRYDPQRWWLARENGRPAGVLLLNEIPEWRSLDVSYLGVVPKARGRGHGQELTRRALRRPCRRGTDVHPGRGPTQPAGPPAVRPSRLRALRRARGVPRVPRLTVGTLCRAVVPSAVSPFRLRCRPRRLELHVSFPLPARPRMVLRGPRGVSKFFCGTSCAERGALVQSRCAGRQP